MSLIKKYIRSNDVEGLKTEKKYQRIKAATKVVIGAVGVATLKKLINDGEFRKTFDSHLLSENVAMALSVITTAIGTTAGINLVKSIVAGHNAKKIERDMTK